MAGALHWFRRLAVPGPAGGVVSVPFDQEAARTRELGPLIDFVDGVQVEVEAKLAQATGRADLILSESRAEATELLRHAEAVAAEERAGAVERRRSDFAAEREELLAQGRAAAASARTVGRLRIGAASVAVVEMLRSLDRSRPDQQ